MNKIRLVFNNATEISGNTKIGLLSLTDTSKRWQLSIVCERSIAIEIEKRKSNKAMCSNLITEVMSKMLEEQSTTDYEIHILDIVDGQYKVIVFNTDMLSRISIRASDAVLLSIVTGIPIFIEERLMRLQSVEYSGNKKGVTVPINAISIPMLEESLKKAIETEDYEMASKIRDEIKKRNRDMLNDMT